MVETKWIPLDQVDFSTHPFYSVDTRDFHVIPLDKIPEEFTDVDLSKVSRYPDRFFFDAATVTNLIRGLYERSGGERKWRHLMIENDKERSGWDLKYIKVVRTDQGLVVCGRNYRMLTRDILESPIKKPY